MKTVYFYDICGFLKKKTPVANTNFASTKLNKHAITNRLFPIRYSEFGYITIHFQKFS